MRRRRARYSRRGSADHRQREPRDRDARARHAAILTSIIRRQCSTRSLLQDHVAVITGGGTGIGLAIARRLGTLGARIAIASRQSENLEQGWAALRASGIDALAVQLDVRKPEQVDEMVERTVKHFGALDILVNNAAGNFICRAEELSPNGWNAVIGIVLERQLLLLARRRAST